MYACYLIYRETFVLSSGTLLVDTWYTFITREPVKRYNVNNIIIEKLIIYLISGTITFCKCLIK